MNILSNQANRDNEGDIERLVYLVNKIRELEDENKQLKGKTIGLKNLNNGKKEKAITNNFNQPEKIYKVSTNFTTEYLDSEFLRELNEKFNEKFPLLVLGKTLSIEGIKIFKAPNVFKLEDNSLRLISMAKFLHNFIATLPCEDDLLEAIYNGGKDRRIFPSIIEDEIGDANRLAEAMVDYCKSIEKKLSKYQDFINYHLNRKKELDNYREQAEIYFKPHLDYYNNSQDKFSAEEKEQVLTYLKGNDYKSAGAIISKRRSELE